MIEERLKERKEVDIMNTKYYYIDKKLNIYTEEEFYKIMDKDIILELDEEKCRQVAENAIHAKYGTIDATQLINNRKLFEDIQRDFKEVFDREKSAQEVTAKEKRRKDFSILYTAIDDDEELFSTIMEREAFF